MTPWRERLIRGLSSRPRAVGQQPVAPRLRERRLESDSIWPCDVRPRTLLPWRGTHPRLEVAAVVVAPEGGSHALPSAAPRRSHQKLLLGCPVAACPARPAASRRKRPCKTDAIGPGDVRRSRAWASPTACSTQKQPRFRLNRPIRAPAAPLVTILPCCLLPAGAGAWTQTRPCCQTCKPSLRPSLPSFSLPHRLCQLEPPPTPFVPLHVLQWSALCPRRSRATHLPRRNQLYEGRARLGAAVMVVFDGHEYLTEEEGRLKEDRERTKYWKRWGSYLAERQWATGTLPLRPRPLAAAAFIRIASLTSPVLQCERTTAPTVTPGAVSLNPPGPI